LPSSLFRTRTAEWFSRFKLGAPGCVVDSLFFAGMVESVVECMRVHSTFPKCLMACVAVLSMLVMSGEGKHRAQESGAVREVMTALAAHPLHGGFLAWACGCLSNLVMLEEAALEFHSLGGVEYVVRVMKVRLCNRARENYVSS
jgi:hypothetical protein